MTKTATVHAQQRWEYLELTRKSVTYLVKELNKPGQDGWELVAIMQGKDRKGEPAWTGILKRPYAPHGPPQPGSEATVGAARQASEHTAYLSDEESEFQLEEPQVPVEEQEPQLPLHEEES